LRQSGAGENVPRHMGLVVCHTADWHLGRTLYGASLEHAHRRFLAWLCGQIVEHAVDVLVIAGDVFDRSVPPAGAEALFYGFLADLAHAAPGVQVIVVAGNHDGPARLSAPAPLLERLGGGTLSVRLVGSVPLGPGGDADPCGLIVPLRTRGGERRGQIVTVPFLRPSDLSRVSGGDGSAADRARALVGQAVEIAGRRGSGVLLGTAHGHVRGARLSPDSERPLLGGEEAAMPPDVFARALAYVALGHLHVPQALEGGRLRYAGSPLPLAFSERDIAHEIVVLREAAGGLVADAVRVPAFLELTRIEGEGGAPLEVAEALARLSAIGPGGGDLERWVQVRVRLPVPRAALKRELADALARGAPAARLVSVEVERFGDAGSAPTSTSAYAELAPEAVLARVWSGAASGPVPERLLHALREAWLEAREEHDADLAELPELALPELGVAELGVAELGVAELGVAELGVAELGVAELGVAELGVAELGVAELGVAELGVAGPTEAAS
jgi:exonuclease SbcD